MARTVTGIDMGLRSAKFLRGYYKGNTFHVTDFALTPLVSKEIAEGWSSAAPGFKLQSARVGLTGRDVNIRYTRVPRVPDWQLKNLMRFEVEEIGDQSGAGVASDFNLLPQLPEIEGEDVVLLAMARETLLEQHLEGLKNLKGAAAKLDAFSPNAIALYNAFIRFGVVQEETVLLANIGHDNLDVVIARGADLLFARNLSGGSRLFDDAIAQRFDVRSEKATEIKETMATLEPGARYTDANQEKASRALLGAAGQLLSLLQSTVLFCKSQVKISGLKLDRVLVCGGGAALTGLPKYLSAGMGVPVEFFDPFGVVDTAALAPEQKQLLDEYRLESVVALGLATQASDPEAYSIEILPKSLRKRREFFGAQIYLIAAAVLALAYLGFDAWHTSSDLAITTTRAKSLTSEYKRSSETHRKTQDLIAENTKLGELAQTLYALKGSGEQLARGLTFLQKSLPSEFWVEKLSNEFRADPDLRIARGEERPILAVVGKAREGTSSLSTLYEGFIAQVRQRLPRADMLRERLSSSGSSFTVDVSVFVPPEPAAQGESSDAGNERKAGDPKKGADKPKAPSDSKSGDARPADKKPSK
jgi:Tfp pilus assembly PilM family ATPase